MNKKFDLPILPTQLKGLSAGMHRCAGKSYFIINFRFTGSLPDAAGNCMK